jgi:hypothetical protein
VEKKSKGLNMGAVKNHVSKVQCLFSYDRRREEGDGIIEAAKQKQ